MNFVKEKIKDFYLLDSKVENIFINEYMPGAPGDYVKVFLYALMYAEHGLEMDNQVMAKQLGISVKKINEAWNYWESMGAIRKHFLDIEGNVEFAVEFLNLKEMLYGKNPTVAEGTTSRDQSKTDLFGSDVVKKMVDNLEQEMGRTFSSSDINMILEWVSQDNASPEVIIFGVKYCIDKGKTSMKYIDSVIKAWTREGLNSVDQVNEKLQEMDERYYCYKRVMKALGFSRNATETERAIMDTWFDEMGYNMDRVLEACGQTAGISNPNIKYVNRVLENWKYKADETGQEVNDSEVVTQSVLNQYFDYLREKAEKGAEKRREEVYKVLPRIYDIDENIRRLGSRMSRALLSGPSGNDEVREAKETMDMLAQERAVILTENNFEMDYTDIKYLCYKCNDTGITDEGQRCDCIKERMGEAKEWQRKRNSAE